MAVGEKREKLAELTTLSPLQSMSISENGDKCNTLHVSPDQTAHRVAVWSRLFGRLYGRIQKREGDFTTNIGFLTNTGPLKNHKVNMPAFRLATSLISYSFL